MFLLTMIAHVSSKIRGSTETGRRSRTEDDRSLGKTVMRGLKHPQGNLSLCECLYVLLPTKLWEVSLLVDLFGW